MFSMSDGLPVGEPSASDLAQIDGEWPQIAAELALLDAEIRVLVAGESVCELDVRRVRRARREVLRAARGTGPAGGAARAADGVTRFGGEAA